MSRDSNPSTRRTVAVTGATGFVGRHLVAELTRRGHAVRALVHTPSSADTLPISGVTIVEGSVFDRAAMARLAKDADVLIHLIGIRREKGEQTFERMHVEATRRAIDAARDAGVTRFIQMSALGADPDGKSPYQRTKFAGEKAVRASDLDWTIFRPSLIHGPDGEFVQMVKGWATGRKAPWFVLPYFQRLDVGLDKPPFPPPEPEIPKVQPVFIDDVARAFADAIDRDGTIGEVIALGGPEELEWPDMLRTLRDAIPLAKKSIPVVGLPAPVAIVQARIASFLGFGSVLPYTVSDAQMAALDNVCALDKARAQLGFEPHALAPAAQEYAPSV